MKILLINSNQFKYPWPILPFGICYIASALEEKGHVVKVLDMLFVKNSKKYITKSIQDFSPDIIGISIRNIDNGGCINSIFFLDKIYKDIIQPAKKSGVKIVLGGSAVNINSEEILNYFDLDYAIIGDGEKGFIDFISRIEKNKPIKDCSGLVYRDKNKIINNGYAINDNLDKAPYPKIYKWIDIKKYLPYKVSIPIQTKRGCSLKCSYCVYNKIEGKCFRLRSPKNIVNEIVDIIKNTGIKRFHFTDSVLNIPLNHIKSVLNEIIKSNLDIELSSLGLNPGSVDEELIKLMKDSGFKEIDVGIESASNKVLKDLFKNYNIKELIKTSVLLKKYNIPAQWYFIMGSPIEDESTIKENFDFIDTYIPKTDLVNIALGVRLYNGSPMSEEYIKKGKLKKGLLKPSYVNPESMNLIKMKYLIKKEALKRNNIMIYEDDETYPIKTMFFFNNILYANKHIWRVYILKRKIEKYLGIDIIKSFINNKNLNKI